MADTGLQWARTRDAIRDFVRMNRRLTPRRAVLCSFDFIPDDFERMLWPELKRFRTTLLVDARQYRKRLVGNSPSSEYLVHPVQCKGGCAFHPKVAFIRAGDRILAGIGSANLTNGGFGGNLELMAFADNQTEDGGCLVQGVAGFLDALVQMSGDAVTLSGEARLAVEKALIGVDRRGHPSVAHSLHKPLASQMRELIPIGSAQKSLTIVSPWHSGNGGDVVSQLLRALRVRPSNATICTEGEQGKGPDLGNAGCEVRIYRPPVPEGDDKTADSPDGEEPNGDADAWPGRLHAKAYFVHRASGDGVLFFGSPNCTAPALLKSAKKGGNVETLAASSIDAKQGQGILEQIKEAFMKPKGFCRCTEPSREGQSCCILEAIVTGKSRMSLTWSRIPRHSVFITKNAQSATRVTVKPGQEVVSGAAFGKLFPAEPPVAPTVLLNREEGDKAAPAPFVVWPRLSRTDLDSDDLHQGLLDILCEELGQQRYRLETAAGASHREDEDKDHSNDDKVLERDLDELTKANHWGELDFYARFAVAFGKRLAHFSETYREGRFGLFRDHEMARHNIPEDLRDAILDLIEDTMKGERKR